MVSLICLTSCAGCTEIPAPAEPSDVPTTLGQSFDPAATGSIQGRVVWEGDIPVAEQFLIRAIAFNPRLHKNPARYSTPHLPRINSKNCGVADAVVFLRGIDPRRSRPWDHPKARIEFDERKLQIAQGDTRSDVGFVRRGDAIEILNRDSEYHNLRARGAAFFGMPLLEANQTHERKLMQAGIVDLTCGAGYYWLHAHLFVAEHPYYARTDADGKFTFDQVPAGDYEVACWLPNWKVTSKEVDPETGIVARQFWAQPLEQARRVRVNVNERREIQFSIADQQQLQ